MRWSPHRELAVRTLLVLIAVGTASPVLVLIDVYTLQISYGVTDPEPMTLALLQHRGIMQLVLGAALVWAAFFPAARAAIALGAIVTKSAFLLLILPDARLRVELNLFSIVFDSACIVLLSALATAYLLGRAKEPAAR